MPPRAVRAIHTQNVQSALVARRVVQTARNPNIPAELKLQSLGSGPNSLVQVDLPASTPFYCRRNALTGVLGADSSSIIARTVAMGQPITRLLARQPLVAQRVLTTEPATLLVGTNKPATLTPLALDGTRDWVVSWPATVDTFAGAALNIRTHTSWAIGAAAPFAHALARGRGAVVIASPAPLTSLELEASESVLVQRRFLAAFSLDPNCRTPPKSVAIGYTFTLQTPPQEHPVLPTELAMDSTVRRAWVYTRQTFTAISNGIYNVYKVLKGFTRRGNSEFVRLYGPGTVLISGSGSYARGEPSTTAFEAAPATQADTDTTLSGATKP